MGIRRYSTIAKPEALGRLVLASGGVPRDYLSLFASSIIAARKARRQAREIGREDVAVAAGDAARTKKRDLAQDVSETHQFSLLRAQEHLSSSVKGDGYTFFRVPVEQKSHPGYEILGQLVDLRFVHLVLAGFSDQHRPGVRYEGYLLDLSEFSDVRLKRGLRVLDIEAGNWKLWQTGRGRDVRPLPGTGLRDQLRQAPLMDLQELAPVSSAEDGAGS